MPTLANWDKRGCPRYVPAKRGPGRSRLYNWDEVVEWGVGVGVLLPGGVTPTAAGLGKRQASAAAKGDPSTFNALADAKLTKQQAEAELAQLRLARERAEVMPRSEVVAQRLGAIEACRSALLAVPRKYADQLAHLDAASVAAKLDEVMREVLALFSGRLEDDDA